MSTRFNMFGVRSRSTTWPDELSRPLLQMKAILFLHSCRDPPPPRTLTNTSCPSADDLRRLPHNTGELAAFTRR
jgi:hypothetical protein